MFKQKHHRKEQGQAVILFALAMIGMLAIVAAALDGGMLYWNQRRGQNAADASVIAATRVLVSQMYEQDYLCGVSPYADEQAILDQMYLYAGLNEVPDALTGSNVEGFYLIEDENGDHFDLPNPTTGDFWRVGETGQVPCAEIRGLHVKVTYPQPTFIAGIIGIAETRATVDAYSTFDHRSACDGYVIRSLDEDEDYKSLNVQASGMRITGQPWGTAGVKSNGGIKLSGAASGGGTILLDDGAPIEWNPDRASDVKLDKLNWPDPANPPIVEGTPPDGVPADFLYDWNDFLLSVNGELAVEANNNGKYHYVPGNISKIDQMRGPDGFLLDGLWVVEGSVKVNSVQNPDGTTPWNVTIAAKGEIQMSGNSNEIDLIAYSDFILFYSESSNNTVGAIKASGSGHSWQGSILAPNGLIEISSAQNNILGSVLGYQVSMSGSNFDVVYQPDGCPFAAPRVLLAQ